MEKKKGFQMPHTYIIIFGVILFAALLTVFIPLGKYDTKEITYMQNGVEKTRTVLDPESFQYILDENGNKVTKAAPIFGTEDFGGQGILNYVFEGMTVGDKNGTAVGIIAFILVVGDDSGIVLRTGAIESGIMRVIALTNGREILLIPILVVLFSLGGAVFGMGEEAIPFVMILVPMFIAMGYDAVVGIMCSYVSTQIGFGSSWQNPFGLAVAQGVAGIPVMSGAWFRIPLWIFFTGLTIVFTMRYAVKIKKDPKLSVAYESDEEYRKEFAKNGKEMPPFTLGHKLVLLTVAACMVWTIWGVISEGYYIPEIASQFFVMGLVSGIIGVVFKLNDMKVNDIAKSFDHGARSFRRCNVCRNGAGYYHHPRWHKCNRRYGLKYDPSQHQRRNAEFPAGDLRMVYVYLPVRVQLLRCIRFRTGCTYHADHGSSRRSCRCRETGCCCCVPAW